MNTRNIILAIDPATTNLGICIMEIINLQIVDIKTHEIIIPKYLSNDLVSDPIHKKIELVEKMVLMYCQTYTPSIVSVETPFIDRFRPTSAIPLSRTLQAITSAFRKFNQYIYINMISPSTVKNSVGAKGGTDKIAINDAILKINELSGFVDFNTISEHEVDSVAIAYNLLLQIRQQSMLIYL